MKKIFTFAVGVILVVINLPLDGSILAIKDNMGQMQMNEFQKTHRSQDNGFEPRVSQLTDEPFQPVWMRSYYPGSNHSVGGYAYMHHANNSLYIGNLYTTEALTYANSIVNYDLNGTLLWNRSYEIPWQDTAITGGITSLNNSMFMVREPSLLVSRFAMNGTPEKDFIWSGVAGACGLDITASNDSLYIVGFSRSGGNVTRDIALILKMDYEENVIWYRLWNGSYDSQARGVRVIGGYIYVAGVTSTPNEFLLKYDTNGTLVWARAGSNMYIYGGYAITSGENGMIYLVCLGSDPRNIFILKYDANGTLISSNKTRYTSNMTIQRNVISYYNKTLYLMAESEDQCALIFKFDSFGSPIWIKKLSFNNILGSGGIFVADDWDFYVSATFTWNFSMPYAVTLMKGVIPTMPLNFTADSLYKKINLTWKSPTDTNGMKVADYNLYRNGTPGNFSFYLRFPAIVHNYTDTNVTPGVRYCYRITAVVPGHEGEASVPSCAYPYVEPGPPRNLTASPYGYKEVALKWEPPSLIGGDNITNYSIYRSKSSGGEKYYADAGNGTNYMDVNVTLNETYYYVVIATNDFGLKSLSSNEANAMPNLGGTVPGPPRNLSGYLNINKAELRWTPPLDNGSYEILHYRIYKGVNQSKKVLYENITPSITYRTDIYVTPGNTYRYQVTAVNFLGEGPPSNEIVIEYPPPPPPFVISTNPKDHETGILTTANISISFSEEMDHAATENAISASPTIRGVFAWDYSYKTVTWYPSNSLDDKTAYTITIGTEAKSIKGAQIKESYTFVFTTKDMTPPSVVSTNPANGTSDWDLSSKISITFSEPMDQNATTNAVSIFPDSIINWEWNSNGTTLVLTASLQERTTYTVIVSTTAEDLAGNHLSPAYTFSFTTKSSASPSIGGLDTPSFVLLLILIIMVIILLLFFLTKRRKRSTSSSETETESEPHETDKPPSKEKSLPPAPESEEKTKKQGPAQ
jgi:hypothetical protein